MDFLRNHQKRKANIQGTLAAGNEPLSSLSFPNPGGRAVASHALAPPRHKTFMREKVVWGTQARRISYYSTAFRLFVKKFMP